MIRATKKVIRFSNTAIGTSFPAGTALTLTPEGWQLLNIHGGELVATTIGRLFTGNLLVEIVGGEAGASYKDILSKSVTL